MCVTIKGLQMPENCFRCFASSWYNHGGTVAGFRCNALPESDKIISNCEGRSKRRDDCPIVAISEDKEKYREEATTKETLIALIKEVKYSPFLGGSQDVSVENQLPQHAFETIAKHLTENGVYIRRES